MELLPCPFCGGGARIQSNRDWHKLYAAHDDHCVFEEDDPNLTYPAQPGYLKTIQEVWNRRHAAEVAAPSGASVEGWISVDERLPAIDTEVLIWPNPSAYVNSGYIKTRHGITEWFYGEYEHHHGHVDYGLGTELVTHWMPLPAPPVIAAMSPNKEG